MKRKVGDSMDKSEILKQYYFIPNKLLEYGLKQKNENYVLEKSLNEELDVTFMINRNSFQIDVYEKNTKEQFLPFYIKNAGGSYLLEVKSKIEEEIKNLLNICFKKHDKKEQLLFYVKQKYGTLPEYPWKDSPTYCTLKTNQKQKWYGLFMNIPYKTLGLKGEELVDVVNLKNDPETIAHLIDYKNFFPAYHMNKKYWYTILLDPEIDLEKVKTLIDESYQSVLKKGGKNEKKCSENSIKGE